MEIRDNRATDLRNVNDLVVDLNSGRVLAAIIGTGGILGRGETLHAVPPGQLRFSADKLTANFAKDKLDRAPRFTAKMWNTINDPKWATDVYSYYQEPPFWHADTQRVRDPSRMSPEQQPQQQPKSEEQPETPSTPETPSPAR